MIMKVSSAASTEAVPSVVVVKLISAAVLFLMAFIGAVGALKVEALRSMVAIHIAYAFAAGILLAVALVHMLPENAETLDEAGMAFSKALGGDPDDAFPLGNALFVLGFLLITVVESTLHVVFGPGTHDHGGGDQAMAAEPMASGAEPMNIERDDRDVPHNHSVLSAVVTATANNSGGWTTLVGLSIHSVIEGLATGAGNDASAVTFLVAAIACHKGFAAFALAAANLPLRAQGRKTAWWTVSIWFALSGPLGILLGALISASVEGPTTAGITCVAAGSLLSVGINEMLSPALHEGKAVGVKLLVFALSLCSMSLLAVWV